MAIGSYRYIKIDPDTTHDELCDNFGISYGDSLESVGFCVRGIVPWSDDAGYDRAIYDYPNVGEVYYDVLDYFYDAIKDAPDYDDMTEYKIKALNEYMNDKDTFEHLSQMSELEWKAYRWTGEIPGYLSVFVKDDDTAPDLPDMLGNGDDPVPMETLTKVMKSLQETGTIDQSIFVEYSADNPAAAPKRYTLNLSQQTGEDPLAWANLPWGEVSIHSEIAGISVNMPVYPQGISDGVQANYDTMPDMLYQYEPWQVYQSSGPRAVTYTFDLHRDMFGGAAGHTAGDFEKILNFFKGQCYALFDGASVQTSCVSVYIHGKQHIRGIMTSVKDEWDENSPIGVDGMPLHVTLSLSITEVSETPLTFDSFIPQVRQ